MWTHAVLVVCLVCKGYGAVVRGAQSHVTAPAGTIAGFEEVRAIDGHPKIVTKFLGIPYAENPAGVNRFKKPIPKAMFTGTYNATSYAPACLQGTMPGLTRPNGITVGYSEDCLMLNVYVPKSYSAGGTSNYPVLIWIHGGAFYVGTSSWYQFEMLSLYGDIIVVTLNYRLAEFGFVRSPDGDAVGNQGLWDQQLAMKWVNRNIRAFQGDPNDVTIAGESAGATSTVLHAMYAGNKGLFRRVIAESGFAFSDFTVARAPNVESLTKVTGCDQGGANAVACLRSMTGSAIHAAYLTPAFVATQTSFGPYLDGDFIVESPHDILYGNNSASAAAREFFGSLDFLSGVNNQDGGINLLTIWSPALLEPDVNRLRVSQTQFETFVIPSVIPVLYGNRHLTATTQAAITKAFVFEYTDWENVNDDRKRVEMLVMISSDVLFVKPAITAADGHARMNRGRTYFYEFRADPTTHNMDTPTFIHGANHEDELQYMQGLPLDVTQTNTYTAQEVALSKTMMTLWSNFIKHGDPNSPVDAHLPTPWPQYDATNQKYLVIDYVMTSDSVQHRYRAKNMAFFTYLVPEIIKSVVLAHSKTGRLCGVIPFAPGSGEYMDIACNFLG